MYSVAYGNGFWVAVPVPGYNAGRLNVSSDNGLTWSSVIVNGAQFCNTVAFGNSTWVSLWRDGQMFTASTPTSWAVNNNFSDYTYGSGSEFFRCAVWNGTNWIISGPSLGLAYSPDLVTYTSVGCVNFGNTSTAVAAGPISYSSAYARWYTTYARNGTRGVYSSADGRAWTQVITPSFNNLYGVEVAGSNPILLAQGVGQNGSGASSAYLKSTDGTTWTQASDIRAYTGPLTGLSNGAFVRFGGSSSSQYYISTDPSSVNGVAQTNSISSFVSSNLAASATDGRWIVLGYVSGGTIRSGGGSSNVNINTFFDTTLATGTYGVPTSITYNPDNNLFYWTTSLGFIMSQANYNSTPTVVIQQFGVGSAKLSIHYFNGFMYLTINSNTSNVVNNIYISNSSNFGSFAGSVVTTNNNNPYYGDQDEYATALQQRTFANSGTRLVKLNGRGFTYTTESTSPTSISFDPSGVLHYQRVNGLDYTYGGQTSSFDQLNGIYEYADITTTRPSVFQFTLSFGSSGESFAGRNRFLTYAGSNYYIVGSNGLLFTGPTMATLVGTSVSTTSVNGELWTLLSGSSELQTSGSNFYSLSSQQMTANVRMQLGFTNNISGATNNSFMTGSIIQID
jgi:hypothetical protein